MATIVYLDVEDEITSAAARIRAAADSRVGLVLPFGSRVATSRINFRLLAREAMSHGRRLDIVAPDASARALAASAGLPVFGSVGEYEAALDIEDDDKAARRAEARAAAGIGGGAAAVGGAAAAAGAAGGAEAPESVRKTGKARGGAKAAVPVPDATQDATRDATPNATPEPALAPILAADSPIAADKPASIPVAKPRRSRGRLGLLVGVLLVVAIIGGVAAFAGYLLLPSTSITLTPHIEAVGPVTFTVRADPSATSVDEAAAVVPAVTLTIPVSAQADFPATGKRVAREPAKGAVRWTNCDPTSPYRIPSGTIVRTTGGVGFAIDEGVFLPVAILSGGGATPKLDCQTSEVSVTAVEPGPAGNVDAGTIRVVPASYNRNVIRVNNPQATSGGTREEFTRISPKDVEAAMNQLDKDIRAQFATEVANPSDVPEGTTAFPETAVLGDPTPTTDPASLVGKEVDSFNLELTAEGTVLAADASPAEGIAEQRLEASVADGYDLVPDSTSIEVGEGTVVDGVIEFPVTGSAKQVRPLDAAALERSVLGLPIEDARAVLAPYGDVVIVPWPDWVTTVPTLDQRVILTVTAPVDPAAVPESSPAASPGSSPSAGLVNGGRAGQPVPSAG